MEFLETWKCQGIRLRLEKVRERLRNLCSRGNLVVTTQKSNLPVLYLYCNSFLLHDVCGEFGLINVYLFDLLPAILSRKGTVFFCLESVYFECIKKSAILFLLD